MSHDGPDLVVAGAGGGLSVPCGRPSSGLVVLVVERNEHFAVGNNTAMSTAMVPGAGSRWQREPGIEDSPELFVADLVAKTHGEADLRLAGALAGVSARARRVDGRRRWGCRSSLVTDFPYPGHSRLRCHTVPGAASAARLLRRLVRAVRAERPRST